VVVENQRKDLYRGSLLHTNASSDNLIRTASIETLDNPLWLIEYFPLLHELEDNCWPHYTVRNMRVQLNKYKFNCLQKSLFIYYWAPSLSN
jgi:hypothetical protein